MNLQDTTAVIRKLINVKWRWSLDGWEAIVVDLGLTTVYSPRGGSGNGKPYQSYWFSSGIPVYAFIRNNKITLVHSTIDPSIDLEGFSEAEADVIVRDSLKKYRAVVDQTINILGRPIFDGSREDISYPEEVGADYGAVWYVENAQLIIILRYPEDEYGSPSVHVNILPLRDND